MYSVVCTGVGSTRTARYYQVDAMNRVLAALEENNQALTDPTAFKPRMLVVHPTGTGKTFSAQTILTNPKVSELLRNGSRVLKVLWVAYSDYLRKQAAEEFSNVPNIEIIPYSPQSQKWDELTQLEFHICVIDEAHHESCSLLQAALHEIVRVPVLGLTANNKRTDGVQLKFDYVFEVLTREDAELQGFIAQPDIHSFFSVGNYVEVTKRIVKQFPNVLNRSLTFAKNKADCDDLVTYYRGNFPSLQVANLNELSGKSLKDTLSNFSNGEIDHLVSVKKIGEGTDLSGVEGVILARAYGSDIMLNQNIGRAARVDNPKFTVVEIVNPFKSVLTTLNVINLPKSHTVYDWTGTTWEAEVMPLVSAKNNPFLK